MLIVASRNIAGLRRALTVGQTTSSYCYWTLQTYIRVKTVHFQPICSLRQEYTVGICATIPAAWHATAPGIRARGSLWHGAPQHRGSVRGDPCGMARHGTVDPIQTTNPSPNISKTLIAMHILTYIVCFVSDIICVNIEG